MAGTKVRWTDEEWDTLANIVHPLYLQEPTTPMSDLLERAMAQFPAHRRRKVPAFQQLQPLFSRMIAKSQKLMADSKEVQSLRDQVSHQPQDHELYHKYRDRFLTMLSVVDVIQAMPLERILAEVPDEELFILVARRMAIISQMARSMRAVQQQLPTEASDPQLTPRRKPMVVIAGPKGDQIHNLEAKLRNLVELRVVDKDNDNAPIPTSGDLYVAWTKFISHKFEERFHLVADSRGATFKRTGNVGLTEIVSLIQQWMQGR
jgi:hypothetical protein